MGTLKVKDQTTGLWVYAGTPGPAGPTGPTGPMGVSSVIVGDFGAATTPADLPVDGLIPVDWDGPGNPAATFQMEQGWSLYYDKPTDPTLDGHLFQYVGTGIDPAGWLDIGLIQGPQGRDGPTGATGPTGPPSEDVHVGPDTPPLPVTELWYDTDDPRLLGPFFLPDGGLAYDALAKTTDLDGDFGWRNVYSVPSGKVIQFPNAEGVKVNLYGSTFGLGITASTLSVFTGGKVAFRGSTFNAADWTTIDASGVHVYGNAHVETVTDGYGLKMNGGGYIYKKSGTGITIRKHSGNTMVGIEQNDGSGRKDILVAGGGQTMGQHVNLELSSHLVINGSTGTNSAHYYVNCATNDNGYYFNVLEARRQDNVTVFVMKGYQRSGASPDCQAKMYANLGTEGIDEVNAWQDYGDGQVCVYSHGPMSSTHFQDRNLFAAAAGTQAPVDPELVGRLIDAVKPVTFARHFRSLTATDANPPDFVRPHHDPIPTIGLDIDGVNGECGDLAERVAGGQHDGYSLGGMLAVAVAEIKSLRARVAQLEGAA